jgi:hypothetical protein
MMMMTMMTMVVGEVVYRTWECNVVVVVVAVVAADGASYSPCSFHVFVECHGLFNVSAVAVGVTVAGSAWKKRVKDGCERREEGRKGGKGRGKHKGRKNGRKRRWEG